VAWPETLLEAQTLVTTGAHHSYIPRGLGRAYGDAALNKHRGVAVQTGFHHFLSFDEESGVLECEAGVSFADILRHLLPRGWFLPTTPGTKYVTVGGAIAADVHGKNHHLSGSFGNFVLELHLLTASGNVLVCSPTHNTDVFWATVGGMGLTGVILRARLQLAKVESAYVDVRYRRTASLDEVLEQLSATEHLYRYSVAWVDSFASGASLGRSVLMLANDAKAASVLKSSAGNPLSFTDKRELTVPFHCPQFLLNPLSLQVSNSVYYAVRRDAQVCVDYETFFYPLDKILHWNRLYGRRGFIQYQALFPKETARSGLIAMLEKISSSRKASFLAVLKGSGAAGNGLLSYLYPGYTLALDFPNTGQDLQQLLQQLDDILLKHGGRLYLAKDAMMTPEVFAAMYPRLREFQEVKAKVDPYNRFASSQARRLGIVEAE
jgi:FAD/FMN-containing dehydrogenase